jgi:hypothetical protein
MINRLFFRLTLRCFISVFLGAVVVTGFSGLLSLYGEAQDSFVIITTPSLKLPKSEVTMQGLADRFARGAAIFSRIAPSAGQ